MLAAANYWLITMMEVFVFYGMAMQIPVVLGTVWNAHECPVLLVE